MLMRLEKLKMLVEKYQCPGCLLGGDTGCGSFKRTTFGSGAGMQGEVEAEACGAHVAGTAILGAAGFYLGMPKGFNRVGPTNKFVLDRGAGYWPILFYAEGSRPKFTRWFRPIWALEKDGMLFVRSLEPRLGRASILVVEGGTLADVPGAEDVSTFQEEMD